MNVTPRQIHLVLKQALEDGTDEKLTEQARRQREEGLGWRYDGLADWTTNAIFEKLHELGVDTDADRFADQARAATRCMTLEENWREGLALDDGPWDDFPFLASEELWRRLTPDLPCPELIADRLEEHIRSTDGRSHVATYDQQRADMAEVDLVLDYLDRSESGERAAKFDELRDCGLHDFGSWLLELVLTRGDLYPDEVTRLADRMSEFYEAENFQGDLACALAHAKREDEALERVRRNLELFPDDVWIRIKAGDAHEEMGNDEQALRLYREALPMASEPYDWDGVEERLVDLSEATGSADVWESLKRRHPRPTSPSVLPTAESARTSSAAHARRGHDWQSGAPMPPSQPDLKVGRNDPCPCGSGRKHKKCCLARA